MAAVDESLATIRRDPSAQGGGVEIVAELKQVQCVKG